MALSNATLELSNYLRFPKSNKFKNLLLCLLKRKCFFLALPLPNSVHALHTLFSISIFLRSNRVEVNFVLFAQQTFPKFLTHSWSFFNSLTRSCKFAHITKAVRLLLQRNHNHAKSKHIWKVSNSFFYSRNQCIEPSSCVPPLHLCSGRFIVPSISYFSPLPTSETHKEYPNHFARQF